MPPPQRPIIKSSTAAEAPNCRHSSQIKVCIDCRSYQSIVPRRRTSSVNGQTQQQQQQQQQQQSRLSIQSSNLPTAEDILAARLQRSLRVTSMSVVASISMMPLKPAPREPPQRRSLQRLSVAEVKQPEQRRHSQPTPPPPTPPPPTPPPPIFSKETPRAPSEVTTPRLRPAPADDASKYRRSHLAAVSARKSRQFTRILRLRQKRRRHTGAAGDANDHEIDQLVGATTEAAFVSSAATNSPFFSYFTPLPRYRERERDILSLVKPPRDRFRERMRRSRQPTAAELAYGGFEPGDFLYELADKRSGGGSG